VAQAAAAMLAVVLAEVLLEAVGAAAADRAELVGPVAAVARVVVAGLASSNPEVPANFNRSSLLLVA
jgi:hypothetical protein